MDAAELNRVITAARQRQAQIEEGRRAGLFIPDPILTKYHCAEPRRSFQLVFDFEQLVARASAPSA
jgi:hypothetical protein